MVQKNTIANSTAQHSTAQHSTAQHSTAQHSTAQFKYAYLTPLDDVYLVKRLNCGNKEARLVEHSLILALFMC